MSEKGSHSKSQEVNDSNPSDPSGQNSSAAQDRLQYILTGAGLGSWDWWLDTNAVRFDRLWAEMLGLKLEEIEQHLSTWDSRVHPDDKARAYEDIKNYLDGKTEVYENIHRIRHAKGHWVWILDRGRISEYSSDGKALRFTGTHFDITRFKESEVLNSSIQSIAQIGGWELDVETMTTKWTDETYRIHNVPIGTPTNTLMGISFFAPQDQLRISKCIEECIAGKSYRQSFEFRDAAGKQKWVEAMGEPVLDAHGRVIKLRGTFQDISERKRQELETRAKELELKQVMDAIDRAAIVAFTDRDGNITQVNENFCKISGYSAEELIGQTHRLINAGIHSKSFFRELWQKISASQPWSGEIENRSKSGERYIVQSLITPLTDINGKINRYMALRFDVTRQRESERMLREAQQVAKIGSWSLQLKSGKMQWSEQMFELFPEDPSLGPPSLWRHLETIHPDDRDSWQKNVENCILNGESFSLRYRFMLPNGAHKWIEAHCEAARDSQAKVQRIGGTCQDVSALVLAENAVRAERAKAMQAAKLASLGELSASIAHEINNPLTIIAGMIHGLDQFASRPEKLKSRVESIEKASDRIARIVQGLKKFSRTSDGTERKLHPLRRIFDETLVMTGAKARRSGVDIQLNCPDQIRLNCDEIEIEQVMINLLNNAIDAVSELKERWVKIEVVEVDAEVVIKMRDSGPGIPAQQVEKLFQPFFTTKPVGQGTGLGLAIVKGILDEHDASIQILTTEPTTCFEIRFHQPQVCNKAA
jgi:PAS domain S-box-containing protein